MAEHVNTHEAVQEYYGKTLQSSNDLKSNCCTSSSIAPEHKNILSRIDDEVLAKFYGCGSPLPSHLQGSTVLDLGCGTGRDCYLISHLVGGKGTVIGVDMTDEQLDVANRHLESMTAKWGYSEPNVRFVKGYIEDLASCDIADSSVDVVISNCVINLSPDKPKVLSEVFRVLKPGGELYFSDVYSDRRVPQALREDNVFYGECLGGALYYQDFRRIIADFGCRDPRIVSSSHITLDNPEIEARAGTLQFYSMTIRAFKLDLEDRAEDYGQVAVYRGAPDQPHRFVLDEHHCFETGRAALVDGNTADILSKSRLNTSFDIIGTKNVHYGLFGHYPLQASAADSSFEESGGGGGCC
ncbi:MAG: methyltransferase domain-containing protein [Chitinivibrionales bacterium]|nr:methyltransferase domain-containing protein [Chitinivibrionales bacterium]